MPRSRSQLNIRSGYNSPVHKPGAIPNSCRNVSPISSKHHQYELKQNAWSKHSIESWFSNHSVDERRVVYSFLNALHDDNNHRNRIESAEINKNRKPSGFRSPRRMNTNIAKSTNNLLQRQISNSDIRESRASKRDLGEIIQTLQSMRPPSSAVREKGIQTTATPIVVPLPDVTESKQSRKSETNSRHSKAITESKYVETIEPIDTKTNDDETHNINRRFLSQTWRVINPLEDPIPNIRPENNTSSFFNYTKKAPPEYFFIHPDWY